MKILTSSEIQPSLKKWIEEGEEKKITVELTVTEARVILALTGHISGSRTQSIRKYTAQIYESLIDNSCVNNGKPTGMLGPLFFEDTIKALNVFL